MLMFLAHTESAKSISGAGYKQQPKCLKLRSCYNSNFSLEIILTLFKKSLMSKITPLFPPNTAILVFENINVFPIYVVQLPKLTNQ